MVALPGKQEEKSKKASHDDEKSYNMSKAIKVYTKNGLLLVFFCSLFFFLAAQTDRQISDWWIRMWVAGEYNGYKRCFSFLSLPSCLYYYSNTLIPERKDCRFLRTRESYS